MPAAADPAAPYRVLARKYRPRDFTDLIGQEAMVRTLTNAMAAGPPGARLHAHGRARRRQDDDGADHRPRPELRRSRRQGRPDGAALRRNATTASPSPRTAISTSSRWTRRAASGVDEMRELLDGVRYRPVSARYKVYIIDEVHMLSDQRLQRAAEDAGGAAGACEVHLRDDGDPQGAGHRAVALPALRSAPRRYRDAVPPLPEDRRGRGRDDRAGRGRR